MEPMRVLQVLGGLNRGGAETMVMNLYRAVDKSRVQFDFIIHSPKENAYRQEIEALGGRVYVFPRLTAKNVRRYRRHWDTFLGEHPEYRILHSHVRSYAVVFLGIARRHGLTTIVHSHSTSNGSGAKARVKGLLQRPLRKRADYLFACSRISGEWLFGKRAVEAPNYRMIKNAIDTERYRVSAAVREQTRRALGVENAVVYGHVGRLSEPKNHPFLLRVFRELATENPDAVLLLVGEGGCRAAIEAQVKELGLEHRVILTGARSDVPQLLSAMDVFLFPSLWEGLPVTVVEAQVAGLPCLVSDTVTEEVAVSAAVTYLPIDRGTACWVEAARAAVGKRFDVIDDIRRAGFDVHRSAEELTEFYGSIYE